MSASPRIEGLRGSYANENFELLDASGLGVGYLDILLNKITGRLRIDPELLERVKFTFINDINACWKLGEIVDNLKTDSVDTPSPNKIISQLWSGHPELAQELKQLFCGNGEIQEDIHFSADEEQNDLRSHENTKRHEPRLLCFCNEERSGTMIASDSTTCTRVWFHLHCVNLVVTPDQNEKWFCSEECKNVRGEVTAVEWDFANQAS
jgi:predicted nucleic acid-binding Zn ribbon protein